MNNTELDEVLENPLDKMIVDIANALQEWKKENTEKVLARKVHARLDANREEILLKLLGFDNKWGEWEVDHCNGRNGNSTAGDYLRKAQNAAIEDWLERIKLPKPSKSFLNKITKDLERNIQTRIENRIWEIAQKEADHILEALIKEVTKSKKIDSYLKVAKVISEE